MRLRNREKEFYACHQTAEEKGKLETRFIDCYIGSGVFALDDIQKGQLVCYYHGELISGKDGMLRLCSKRNEGSFLFFFNDAGKQLCIDGTHSTGLGRLINDNHLNPNCKVKLEEGPKLAIYTIKDVSKGEEIRYDYKDKTAFWRRGCFNHMKGSDSIRRTTKEVQLQHPERITTTKLRKYLATISQLFNLSSTELEELARHMGHELTVHRHYYRLQDDVIELAKVSRLLLAVEEGKAHAFQGCSLDDINVTDIELEEDERMDDSLVDTVQEIDGDSESDLIEDFDVEDVNTNSIDDSLEKEHEEIQDNEYQGAGKQKKDKPSASAKKLLSKDEDSEPKQTKCPKKRWTQEERDILEDIATKSASEKKPPRKAEILKLQAQHPVLKNLKWLSIKYQVWAMAQQKMSGKKNILENWGI